MSEISKLNGYDIKDKKAIRYYDNVSSMLNDTTLKSGMHVKTKGYYTINDNGASEYHITDTESQSEYQEEISEGLYATLITDNKIRVKQFGAYGDNTHDDTASIQKAINYACSHNAILLFDNGKYIISDTLNIPSAIKIEGCYAKGDSTTSIKGAEIYMLSSNKTIFEFATSVSFYQCEIKDIRLNCDINASNCIGIDLSKTTLVSECIFDKLFINGNFNIGLKLANTTITNIRNCMFSINTVAIDLSVSNTGIFIENCDFWNNGNDIKGTGSINHFYILKTHFENTLGNTNILFTAPVNIYTSGIQDSELLSNSSNYAIHIDGSNSSGYVRTSGFYIENTSISAKTGIKVDMANNTSAQNNLSDTHLNGVTFIMCTNYGVDTNYAYTYFILNNCNCYSNWYYGAGTMVNRTTSNYIRTYSQNNGFDIDSTLNFSYVTSNFYHANSLYLDSNNILRWRFNDTSKVAAVAMVQAGGSTSRPASPIAGQMYYDWTIGKPIWFNGTNWIDATGTQV